MENCYFCLNTRESCTGNSNTDVKQSIFRILFYLFIFSLNFFFFVWAFFWPFFFVITVYSTGQWWRLTCLTHRAAVVGFVGGVDTVRGGAFRNTAVHFSVGFTATPLAPRQLEQNDKRGENIFKYYRNTTTKTSV